jgi:hypothetical protein
MAGLGRIPSGDRSALYRVPQAPTVTVILIMLKLGNKVYKAIRIELE